jgi:hypothetical protein
VENKTNFSTRQLRTWLLAALKHMGIDPRGYIMQVVAARGTEVHGYAWYNSKDLVMKLPKPYWIFQGKLRGNGNWSKQRFGGVLMHELGHTINQRHKDMLPISQLDTSWADDLELPAWEEKKMAASPRGRNQPIEVKLAKAQAKVTEFTKKEKRAKTYRRKWETKVKYYQKRKAEGKTT